MRRFFIEIQEQIKEIANFMTNFLPIQKKLIKQTIFFSFEKKLYFFAGLY